MEPGAKYGSAAMIAKLKGGFASSEGGRVVLRHASGEHIIAGLSHESTVSGGELISSSKSGGSGMIRQSKNRITTTSGFGIAWSLKHEPKTSPEP